MDRRNRYRGNRGRISPWGSRFNRTSNFNNFKGNGINRLHISDPAYFSLLHLINLLTKSGDDIVAEMWLRINSFEESLNWNSVKQILAITHVLANVCRSNFLEIKSKILQHVCSTKFLINMSDFLRRLTAQGKDDASVQQNELDTFWESLMELLERIMTLFPDDAQDNLAKIVERINRTIQKMEDIQHFTIKQNIKELATHMSTNFSNSKQISQARSVPSPMIGQSSAETPPEDFRQMSIIPTINDLNNDNSFIRPVRVTEAYDSVDHYLDVQFRLLREDFVSPFRDGVREYLQEMKPHRSRSLRVYKRVRLVIPDERQNNVDITLYFGIINHVDWANSRRFMFGSLLCLSHDNFNTLLFVTVSNRDDEYVKRGKILVTPCAGTQITRDLYGVTIIMLECKYYFEPYSVILTAMKNMCEKNFPMKNYLVNAETSLLPPAYLRNGVELKFNGFTWPVNEDEKWPEHTDLHLDESQYNAFKRALSEEIAIIQGPPGTGKTFIALKLIQALLENQTCWRNHGPIIVVCLTNHALDQFLEGVIQFTNSIVRIGNRSKSETVAKYTLAKRRDAIYSSNRTWASSILRNTKNELSQIMVRIHENRRAIQEFTTPDALVPLNTLRRYYHYAELSNINNLLTWLGIPQFGNLNEPPILFERAAQCLPNGDETLIFPLDHIDCRLAQLNEEIKERKHIGRRKYIGYKNEIRELQRVRSQIQRNLANHPLIDKRPRDELPNSPWESYWRWVVSAHEIATQQTIELENQYRRILSAQTEAKQILDLATLRKHDVIGLTTTSAAKLFAILQSLQAPIVVVEEAAEILEAHIVCSLTKSCQHVIMIGDHKQLKPKIATMKLGTKYNLNVSFFERMVNIRGTCPQLAHQHRMRPEIARLICPSIYETLHNHESVLQYPPILGLYKNLFFLHHEHSEETLDNDESLTNPFEARFLVAFTRYLMLQGYQTTDITILCTYTGQIFTITKEKNAYPDLRNIRVTSVDNYQGEECKIILLSLVRNNENGNIGFLHEENRVCVALSRAREGLFIMGNMKNLTAKQNVWSKVKTVLENEKALGDALPLRCQIHHDELTMVRDVADFKQSPKGGCTKKCESELHCGHICPSICHTLNRAHTNIASCKEPCKKRCPDGHACLLTCSEICKPCRTRVDRELKCGHTATVLCSRDPEKYQCIVKVDAVLPYCNHKVQKQCYRPVNKFPCSWPCEIRLPCGHSCTQNCHANRDPDHIEFACRKECTNNNRDCTMNHPCKKQCFEECEKCMVTVLKTRSCGHPYKIACCKNVEAVLCTLLCKKLLPCGHQCAQECCEPCGSCRKMVKKISPCGHEVDVECCEEATFAHCTGNCQQKLPCGHPCAARCKDTCTEQCEVTTLLTQPALCGHTFSVPCYLQGENAHKDTELLDYCDEPCGTVLSCGHTCKGSCGSCKQKRIHVPCAENCGNILICGHQCSVPCRQVCPPCTEQCKLRCRHSKCNKTCGVPCVQCKEPCEWGCEHSKCTKRCFELCDREPCMKPCQKRLKCKHACIGFCGDPCPPLCRVCDKDQVTEVFLGGEDEPDARFVLLPDCGHCIESSGLSTWIMQHSDSIQMKKCPRCKTVISTCMRIMNQIKVDIEHVQSIKEKIFGNKTELQKSQSDLLETITALRKKKIPADYQELKNLLHKLHTNLIPVRREYTQIINLGAVEANRIVVDSLLKIFDNLNRIRVLCTESQHRLAKQIIMLSKALPCRGQISHQEVTDIQCELRRLDYMTKLHEYLRLANDFIMIIPLDETYQSVAMELQSIKKFDESQESLIRNKMKIMDMTDIIVERKMIVKAIGLKQGHWFKCRNGHFYAIGECGGAMVESKCIECGVTIGGQSHRLRYDNSVATEMDGATRGAWQ